MNGQQEHFNQKEAKAIIKRRSLLISYIITTANNKNNQKSRNYIALIKTIIDYL